MMYSYYYKSGHPVTHLFHNRFRDLQTPTFEDENNNEETDCMTPPRRKSKVVKQRRRKNGSGGQPNRKLAFTSPAGNLTSDDKKTLGLSYNSLALDHLETLSKCTLCLSLGEKF